MHLLLLLFLVPATSALVCLVNTTYPSNPLEKCSSDTENCQYEKRPSIRGRFTVTPTGCNSTCKVGCNSSSGVSYCCCDDGDNCNKDPTKFHCFYGLASDPVMVPCPGKETNCRWERLTDGTRNLSCGGEFCKDKEEGCHVEQKTSQKICCCHGEQCNRGEEPEEDESGQSEHLSTRTKQLMDYAKQCFVGALKRLSSFIISM